MVEQWLDRSVLELLKSSSEPIIEKPEERPPQGTSERVYYNPIKLDVQLPCSTDIEQINYIPPKIGHQSQTNPSSSILPDFIYPSNKFDIFEHFSYEVIPMPD